MKLLRPALIYITVALACLASVHGRSDTLDSATRNLAAVMDSYRMERPDALPKSWGELDRFHSLSYLSSSLDRPIEEMFLLLPDTGILLPPSMNGGSNPGAIIAITRPKIIDHRRDSFGRHLIWQDATGQLHATWVDEGDIAPIFAAAGHPLPTDETYPPDALRRYYLSRFFKWFGIGMVVALGLYIWLRFVYKVDTGDEGHTKEDAARAE